jgi:hypothetical protein
MLIRTKRITGCANRAVQLYSDTNNALVVGNLIDSDHSNTGIVFNGASSNNTVENNVVRVSAGNKTINVGRQYTGSGNQARNNCLWPTAADLAGSNVTQTGNIGANPQFSGHTVTNATCAAKLPAGSPFRP